MYIYYMSFRLVSSLQQLIFLFNPPTFGTFFIQVNAPFENHIVVLNGEITVYSVDSPNGFEW